MQFGHEFGTASRSPAGFSRDMTDADLSSHLGPVASKGGLNVAFFHTKVRLRTKDATRNGRVETRLCVAKQPKGDRYTTAVQFISEEQAAHQFPREFAMFQQYEEVPTTGTPIAELPGMSQSQIGIMLINGIRSVEDLCDVPEDIVAQMGIEASRSQRLAKRWLAKSRDEAEEIRSAEIEAKADAERKALLDRIDRLEAHSKAMEAQNEALRSMSGNKTSAPAVAAPQGAVPASDAEIGRNDGFSDDFDDDDVFGGGDVVAEGNADLNDDETNPLE